MSTKVDDFLARWDREEEVTLPPALKGYKTTHDIKKRLTPKSLSYPVITCSDFKGTYSQAVSYMQRTPGFPMTGRYDVNTAVRLYEKVKKNLPTGRGYLASEANPNLLFARRWDFDEYIMFIDGELWSLAGLDLKFLLPNSNKIWYEEGQDEEIEALIDKLLEKEPRFGENSEGHYEFVKPPNEVTKISQIYIAAEKKAYNVANDIFTTNISMQTQTMRSVPLTIAEKYHYMYLYEKRKYESYVNNRETAKFVGDVGWAALLAWIAASSVLWAAGITIALVFAGTFVYEYLVPPGGPGTALHDTLPTPDSSKMENAYNEYESAVGNPFNHIIGKAFKVHRKTYRDSLQAKIDSIEEWTYIYSGNKLENKLYNILIARYLEHVKNLNEDNAAIDQYIQSFMK